MKRKWIALALVLMLGIGGGVALFRTGKKDMEFFPLQTEGYFTVKRDLAGRATEIRIFEPHKKPKLRTSIAYDETKGMINEVMIYDGEDNLVQGHLMQNGGHAIGPQPPIENPPFALSFHGEEGTREWKYDGQSLLREERSASGYTVRGPEAVVLSTSTK
jgi:YD repeat-containing protein